MIVKGLDEFMTGIEEKEVTLEATVDKDHRKKSGEPIEGEWSATKKGAGRMMTTTTTTTASKTKLKTNTKKRKISIL